MTAEPPGGPVTGGVRSLEVRWIFPGRLEAAMAGWFGRFPARKESREDTYLLDPRLRRLSVKVRGGAARDGAGDRVEAQDGSSERNALLSRRPRAGAFRGSGRWPRRRLAAAITAALGRDPAEVRC